METIQGRKLFKGGNYMRKYFIQSTIKTQMPGFSLSLLPTQPMEPDFLFMELDTELESELMILPPPPVQIEF